MTDKQIIYECDAKDCEQCSSDSICCYCKNIACYKLEEQLKHYKKALEDIEVICVEQNLKHDTTACEILDVIEKMCEELIDERI